MNNPPRSSNPPESSSVGLLIFSWAFVGIPLVWGVTQTIMKSLALFH
jgi:hypothetical protein